MTGPALERARRVCAVMGYRGEQLDKAAALLVELVAIEQMVHGGSNLQAAARALNIADDEHVRIGHRLATHGARSALEERRDRAGKPSPVTPKEADALAEGVTFGLVLAAAFHRLEVR